MDTHTIDRKGILAYLLITFGITYAIELALILPGFRADGVPQFLGQLVIAGVMCGRGDGKNWNFIFSNCRDWDY